MAKLLTVLGCLALLTLPTSSRAAELAGRPVVLDAEGKLLPWGNEDSLYDHVMRLAWGLLKQVPVQPNGLRTYLTYPRFVGVAGEGGPFLSGIAWAHNPAGLIAMLTDSALAYYAYSGDPEVLALAQEALDHQLDQGLTALGDAWSRVPYASSNPGDPRYQGGDDTQFCNPAEPCGRGDGPGIIEPDKVGELGLQLLRFYELTGQRRYLRAARGAARALARHVRAGDADHSPWPFRVDARTGRNVREEYSANVIGPIRLFDELIRLKLGDPGAYRRARALAWRWLLEYPMKNRHWSGYFEDIVIHRDPSENPNQYTPLETARYLLRHPELDPEWRSHAKGILDWVTATFAADVPANVEGVFEAGLQFGAEVVSEQVDDLDKMSSHTARFASVLALWSSMTGDAAARERAYRSFNWAAYFCADNGVVKSSVDDATGYWFSDGYGDYMRHFLSGLAAVPAWAPARTDHLLDSTSVVRHVRYGQGEIAYETFDRASTEVLRVRARPSRLRAGLRSLSAPGAPGGEGYVLEPLAEGGFVLRIRHLASGQVRIFF